MKVFISWSGELSRNLAEVFHKWIPGVIQAAKPYYSPEDISKGARWSAEISKELDAAKVGIICLTPDNLNSPWIMFEAGALSRNIEKSRVCPLLFGIDPSDIEGPLVQFQAAKFSREEIRKVVMMINAEMGERALAQDILNNVFDMWWPRLEESIDKCLADSAIDTKKDIRTDREILDEILSLTRSTTINRISIPPGLLKHLIKGYYDVAKELEVYAGHLSALSIIRALNDIELPVRYLLQSADLSVSESQSFNQMFESVVAVISKISERAANAHEVVMEKLVNDNSVDMSKLRKS